MWAAADVKTSYLNNLQMYTGKVIDRAREKDQSFSEVPYQRSWRGIVTDNFFTSVSLATTRNS